ncbi:hypothetical protein ABPG72_005237 [Tetrahymena utriculariae]
MTEQPQIDQGELQLADQTEEDNIDFAQMRKKDNTNYRNLCKSYSKMIDPPNLEKLAFFIIKKHGDRYEEEVSILHKWTQRFKFFQELNAKQSNIDMRIHEKCCTKIKYEKINKGQQVFMAGDIPEKFYIILSGSVNVLLQKSQEVLQTEIQKSQELYKKSSQKEQSNSIQARVSRLLKKRLVIKKIQDKQQLEIEKKLMPQLSIMDNENQQSTVDDNGSYKLNQSQILNTKDENRKTQNYLKINDQQMAESSPEKTSPLKKHNPIRMSHIFKESIIQGQSGNFLIDLLSKNSNDSSPSSNLRLQNKSPISKNQDMIQGTVKDLSKIQPSSVKNSSNNRSNSKQLDFSENVRQAGYLDQQMQSLKNDETQNSLEGEILEDMQDLEQEEKDLENDPIFKGLGQIKLSDLAEPSKFIQDGVLTHTYLLTLQTGQMFGELGLLMKKPRAATIIAKEDTEFAVLDAEDYIQILKAGEMKKFNRRINFFSSSLLQNCGREVVLKFSYNFEKQKFEKGQSIFSQLELPKFVYLIKKGTIQISKKVEVNEEIEDVFDYGYKNPQQELRKEIKHLKQKKQYIDIIINEYTTGQSFGEMEVMFGCPRTTSAICTSLSATVYALSIKNFLVLLHENKFLVKDFQKEISMKEEYQKNKIKLYLDSIKQQNETSKQLIQEREKVVIKNRKFNKFKQNPTLLDTVFKPSFIDQIQMDNAAQKRENSLEQENSNEFNNPNSPSPKKSPSNYYSPSIIEQQCYKNEKGNKQIDVSDELFENSAFSQFLQELIKIKKQKLQEFKQNKNKEEEDNVENAQIFTTMLYVEQIKKQMQNITHSANQIKPGVVKLKKIQHQEGIDLKDTLNLEMLIMGDQKLKQIAFSPINSSRSFQKDQKKDILNQTEDFIDEILSQNSYYLNQDMSQNNSNCYQKSDSSTKQAQSLRDQKYLIDNPNRCNTQKSLQPSPTNKLQNLDWQKFIEKYKQKLKNVTSIDKKPVSLKKVYSHAVSKKFFQETLLQKKQQQHERNYYLKDLQNSFENNFCTDNEKNLTSSKISRDSYFFSTLNTKENKQVLKKDNSGGDINLENSMICSIEYGNMVADQVTPLNKNDSLEVQNLQQSYFVEKKEQLQQNQQSLTPNKLPKIDNNISSSKLSNSDLDQIVVSQNQTKIFNEQNSPKQKLIDTIGKSPKAINNNFLLKNTLKRNSFENDVIKQKIKAAQQQQIQNQVQENKQIQEYYVNSQYIKQDSNNELIQTNKTNNKQINFSQLSVLKAPRKIPRNSYISQIDMSCQFLNNEESKPITTNASEDSQKFSKPINTFQILKILTKNPNNSYRSPTLNAENDNSKSKLKYNMSFQENIQKSRNNSQRNLIENKSLDKKTINVSLVNQNTLKIQNSLSRQYKEEYNQDSSLFASINPPSEQSNSDQIVFKEIKKSLSFTSKHNLFRSKPSKLYLIDRYSRDVRHETAQNYHKPLNSLIEFQIKKLKLQNQSQRTQESQPL